MNPRDLHGRVIALVLGRRHDGELILSAGIRWRIYGYGGSALWLRSIDGGTKSKLTLREFEDLRDCGRIEVCEHDPLPDLLRRHYVKVRLPRSGAIV